VGSIASGLVEDVTAAVVDGVVAGDRRGGYHDHGRQGHCRHTSGGMKTLGKVVDFFV
jgi:hypothetical protein